MIVAMLAATVLLADTTPAAAPANPPATAAASAQPAAKKKDDLNKMVCHTEEVLGSRMPVKRCVTTAQAEDDKRNAREELERNQTQH